ncbi:heparan-alpha-glucosaminide N-acetyltransferase domain-containing protein [Vibrio mediterranei]|uniref:DUF1624 domain-containing protein n=1 Tax=Vibrio mediterranei TaxID=689 RepID=A0A3G4VJT5_9VIBR|nr:heparan-alpha-glucosaminide N-acetyltransferase domain-containing protein [Vibrio mediterranei]AYV25073.1 DUF1624 domain-containing protein [Vibrio mediterranei]MCG9790509.1 heparan-alpha-glucosaminide N-acetyltransferase domain-containing protein [Vibrio mediterranei]
MDELKKNQRIEGLDFTRFIAFFGMVLVNFKIVMELEGQGEVIEFFILAVEGKAAATFVVLAGLGFGISCSKRIPSFASTLKKSAFLLMIGLLNALVFDADILHYYALYFFVGYFLIDFKMRGLITSIVLFNIVFLLMYFTFDYDKGWDWVNYTYMGFWSSNGFIRNSFFNGWHPVFPWMSFFIFGIILSRSVLSNKIVQTKLMIFGLLGLLLTSIMSSYLQEYDSYIFSTEPIPPVPFYILTGISFSSLVIGSCLRIYQVPGMFFLSYFCPAGRQTLTLYLAHIYIGMGLLERFGMIGNQTASSVLLCSLVFCCFSVAYAYIWSKYYTHGPIEGIMRLFVRLRFGR